MQRPAVPMPLEKDTSGTREIFIDADNKHLIIVDCVFGLWEVTAGKWPGYTLKMGHIGHIAMLEKANVDRQGLEMTREEVEKVFKEIV